MFLFFNLVYLIQKYHLLPFIFGSSKQSGATMSDANQKQDKIDYSETVINPFLCSIFNIKARKHTTCDVKEGKNYHKEGDAQCNFKGVNGVTPEVLNNPIDGKHRNRIISKEQPNANKTKTK